jgi:hypothetical protein
MGDDRARDDSFMKCIASTADGYVKILHMGGAALSILHRRIAGLCDKAEHPSIMGPRRIQADRQAEVRESPAVRGKLRGTESEAALVHRCCLDERAAE